MMKRIIGIMMLLAAMIVTAGHAWADGLTKITVSPAPVGGAIDGFYTNADCAASHIISSDDNIGQTIYLKATPDVIHKLDEADNDGKVTFITAEVVNIGGIMQSRRQTSGNETVGAGWFLDVIDANNGVYSFSVPDDYDWDNFAIRVTAEFPDKPFLAGVKYIDADGTEKTTPDGTKVYILDGTETVLGIGGSETWYICNTLATANEGKGLCYDHTLSAVGNVHLIMADGTKMAVSSTDGYGITSQGSFAIYGQEESSGQLSATGNTAGIGTDGGQYGITISGGIVNASSDDAGIVGSGGITINGGQVTAIGGTNGKGLDSPGAITLGWHNIDDYVCASSYSSTVTVADGKVFKYIENSTVHRLFEGELDAEQITALAGKKLMASVALSFTQLNSLINGSTATSITLDYDYTYDEEGDTDYEDGIVISRDVTIIGTGYTIIDGSSKARIFYVTEGKTLTVKKAVLTNGSAVKGAGVYVEAGATLETDYINFTDNTAVYRGGAIYSEGTVNVDHTIFDKNDITYRSENDDYGGAAVYNMKGSLTIANSRITNNVKNIVPRNGNAGDLLDGVITTTGETLITDSYFANNAGTWGGAISSLRYMNEEAYTLTVKDTEFEGNGANHGSAIYVESCELVVDNCTFEDNCCIGTGSSGTSNTQGGAILVHSSGSSATITNSTFTGNSANVGGAVSLSGVYGDSSIENCTFTDNTATSDGGALYLWTNVDAVITVSESKFSGNTAPWGNAISNDGTLLLSNNEVSSTSADIANYYGVITSEINVDILDHQTVDFNGEILITAKVTDDNENLIKDINFDFTIGESDEVYAYYSDGIYSATYTSTNAGTFVVSMSYPVTDNLVVNTATIRNSKGSYTDLQNQINAVDENEILELSYNYIYAPGIDDVYNDVEGYFDSGVVISSPTIINGNGYTISGSNAKRIFYATNSLTLSNAVLKNGSANTGAAIYFGQGGTVENSIFQGNVATTGGAIYGGTATNCLFLEVNNEFSFANGQEWMTWCSEKAWVKPAGVTAYPISGVSGNVVSVGDAVTATTTVMDESLTMIPANTPLLLHKTGEDVESTSYVLTTGNDDLVKAEGTGWTFYGNASNTAIAAADAAYTADDGFLHEGHDATGTVSYVLHNGKFILVDQNQGLAAHRCLLNVSGSNAARSLKINIDKGEPTAVANSSVFTLHSSLSDWYDLQGRRVSMPARGIYIQQGRKVVIK